LRKGRFDERRKSGEAAWDHLEMGHGDHPPADSIAICDRTRDETRPLMQNVEIVHDGLIAALLEQSAFRSMR
jgi:hypothetical protein